MFGVVLEKLVQYVVFIYCVGNCIFNLSFDIFLILNILEDEDV